MRKILHLPMLLLLTAFMPFCAALSPTESNEAVEIRFVKCIDGDTFTCEVPGGYPESLMKRVNVRIRGIDAPELHDKRPEVKQRALEAKGYLEKRLSEAKKIELSRLGKDKYFRILADVLVDGSDIAKEMLDKSLAVPYDGGTKNPDSFSSTSQAPELPFHGEIAGSRYSLLHIFLWRPWSASIPPSNGAWPGPPLSGLRCDCRRFRSI